MSRSRNFKALLISLFLLPFSVWAEEHAGVYGEEEPLFVNQRYPGDLKGADLRELPLADPKLRVAYYFLLMTSNSGGPVTDERHPEMLEVLSDVKRRGDSATPLWLDIMDKNHNTTLECFIPQLIERIGGIKMEPYVDYLRNMLKTRPEEVNFTTVGQALRIFFKYGTKEDVEMAKALGKKGPVMASSIQHALEDEARRQDGLAQLRKGTSPPSPSQLAEAPTATKSPASSLATAKPAQAPASSTPWILLTVALLGAPPVLWWLLRQRRSK